MAAEYASPDDFDAEAHLVPTDPSEVDDGRFWEKVRQWSSRIPFAHSVVASYYAMRDARTPARDKAIIAGALLYFILPADFIPDFIAVIGFTDDLAVLRLAWRTIGGAITDEHRQMAAEFFDQPGAPETTEDDF